MPRGGVSVKFSPQALQRKRCLPRMNPFLTCSPLPHPLHRNAIRSPHRQPHRRWIWAIYADLKPSERYRPMPTALSLLQVSNELTRRPKPSSPEALSRLCLDMNIKGHLCVLREPYVTLRHLTEDR